MLKKGIVKKINPNSSHQLNHLLRFEHPGRKNQGFICHGNTSLKDNSDITHKNIPVGSGMRQIQTPWNAQSSDPT